MSHRRPFPDHLHTLFAQLDPLAFQQFTQAHQHWTLLQRRDELEIHIASLQEELAENDIQLQWTQPSAIALAAIARFQAYGVDDINLIDTMLERGETWLDQTLQLLEQCEGLGLIGDSYTTWCEHALEGAYDWIASMHSSSEEAKLTIHDEVEQAPQNGHQPPASDITEEMLIHRLMSEDETEKLVILTSLQTGGEQDDASNATLPTLDATEVQSETTPIDILSTNETLNGHKESIAPEAVTTSPVEVEAASDTTEEHTPPSETPVAELLETSESPIEVPVAAELLTASELPVEASATPELPDASDPPIEAPVAVEASEIERALIETPTALEAPEIIDAQAEAPVAAETLETPNAAVEVSDARNLSDAPEALKSGETPVDTMLTPDASEASKSPAETPEVLQQLETSDAPVEDALIESEHSESEHPDASTSTSLEDDKDEFGEVTLIDVIAISRRITAPLEEQSTPTEQPATEDVTEKELPTAGEVTDDFAHEADTLEADINPDSPQTLDAEESSVGSTHVPEDVFNEYSETATTDDQWLHSTSMHEPEPDMHSVHTDPASNAESTQVEAVDEEQNDPFTVDGTVTYIPTSTPGTQMATTTSVSKPKRRFFLWRLLARIFRRSAKKSL